MNRNSIANAKNNIKELSLILSRIDNADIIEDFFKSILTSNEIDTINLRWELVKLLYQGYSQRSISKRLKLSLCKITRGSKELKKENSVFVKIIEKYLNLKKGVENVKKNHS